MSLTSPSVCLRPVYFRWTGEVTGKSQKSAFLLSDSSFSTDRNGQESGIDFWLEIGVGDFLKELELSCLQGKEKTMSGNMVFDKLFGQKIFLNFKIGSADDDDQ
eukprot:TRINITY_DN29098_c0_g1_i2.p3 TRINITY_DN29098_c0_g1~~TRINITY_DN29098_c0_g1_i2.p3  ORF type:complete len:104 (-),score=16.47 TRINITY_DN29098_c0_g1_i2:191-502(-)